MANPLTSLDELIWKQYEKITVAANSRLGWNKYDLARIMDDSTAIFSTGGATYLIIRGVMDPIARPSVIAAVTKKPFWKTMYEGMGHKFKPKPALKPIVEPGKQYAAGYFI